MKHLLDSGWEELRKQLAEYNERKTKQIARNIDGTTESFLIRIVKAFEFAGICSGVVGGIMFTMTYLKPLNNHPVLSSILTLVTMAFAAFIGGRLGWRIRGGFVVAVVALLIALGAYAILVYVGMFSVATIIAGEWID